MQITFFRSNCNVLICALTIVLIYSIIFLSGCEIKDQSSDVSNNRTGLNTPEILLKTIYSLASQNKYTELRQYIYPLVIKETSIQDLIIDGIREKKRTGDFAYSDEALASIVNYHINRIIPITTLPRNKYREIEWIWTETDEKLKNVYRNNPNDFSIFYYGKAFVVMAAIDGNYQLIFWENLNDLI